MKKIIFLMLLIICVILSVNYYSNTTRKYSDNWNISMPKDIQLVSSYNGEIGFQGDGCYFEKYTLNKESDFLDDFIKDKDIDIEEKAKKIIEQIDPSLYQSIDFDNPYLYKYISNNDDKMIMLYIPRDSSLIILQELF